MSMIDCPICKGGSNPFVAFPAFPSSRFVDKIKNKSEKEIMAMFPCLQCDGKGKIPEEMFEWIKEGNKLKDRRINAKMTLRDAAKMLDMDVSILSQMERGKIIPDMSIYYKVFTG